MIYLVLFMLSVEKFNDEELLQVGRVKVWQKHYRIGHSWEQESLQPDRDEELMRLSILEWVKRNPRNAYGASLSVKLCFLAWKQRDKLF